MSGWIPVFCLLAGACDAATGALLVATPGWTLALMGIAPPAAEPVFLRFIGAFVGAVGLAYLYPFALDAAARPGRWAVVLEVTALVRIAVGSFVAASVAWGLLEPAWSNVAATDLALAACQILVVRRLGRPSLESPAVAP